MTSFMRELYSGVVRWDLLQPFPRQDPQDRAAGDAAIDDFLKLLLDRFDPDLADAEREYPPGLVEELAAAGYFDLEELSPYNKFRLLEATAQHSMAMALTLGWGNGLGSQAYLPLLPDGPLKDFIASHRPGIISGGADSEPAGAGNRARTTTATPTEDGQAYILDGEKVFIGNATVGGLMDVSATVVEEGEPRVNLFFVDLTSPGVQRGPRNDLLGFNGSPIGVVRLSGVRVPRTQMLGSTLREWRQMPGLTELMNLARLYLLGPTSLAALKLCLKWSREFAAHRHIDGKPLAHYDQIRRILTATAADTHAVQSLMDYCLLAEDTLEEQALAKNLGTMAAWRAVERTMSLMAGEGYETVASKARRGAPPIPLERLFRDVRGLRIAGGVDFQVDFWRAQSGLFAYHYSGGEVSSSNVDESFLGRQARRWAKTAARLVRRYPDPEQLEARSQIPITMNRIGSELLLMSLAAARAGADPGLETVARQRLSHLWLDLSQA